MGAALGAGLGALLGVAGGYEKAQAQKRMDEHGAVMDLIKAHPEMGNDPDFQAMAKKKGISPEYLQLVGAVGKGNAAFQGDVQKATADSPAGQLMGAPGAAQGPQGTAQPAGGVDPLAQHIQMVDRNIANLEKLLPKYMNDPAKVKVIQDTLSEFRQHRAEYATAQEHQETRQFQHQEHEDSRADRDQARAEARADRESARADRAADRATARQDRLDARKQVRDDREEARKEREADKATSEADRKQIQKDREADRKEAQADRQFAANDKVKDAWRDRMEKRLEKIQDFPTSPAASKLTPDEVNRQLNTKIAAYTALLKSDETGFKKRGIDVDTSDLMPSLTPATAASGGVPLIHWGGKPATTATVDTGTAPDAGTGVDPAEAAFRKKHGL